MKKFLVGVLLFGCLGMLHSSFVEQRVANEKLKFFHQAQMDSLIRQVDSIQKDMHSQSSRVLTKRYKEIRARFKSIEFLLAHFDHFTYEAKINGAPLPKLERNVPEKSIQPPIGLQVIDEYMTEPMKNLDLIGVEFKRWSTNLKDMKYRFAQYDYTDEMVALAVQYELIRIYTMGITGFDTPGTQLGIEDAQHVVDGLIKSLKHSDLEIEQSFYRLLGQNSRYLKSNNNFSRFDRITYYQKHWQPLYAAWIQQSIKLNINNWDELEAFSVPLNTKAEHLFSSDFLNLEVFLDFDPKYYNPATIELGRRLFFDPSLSANNKLSCSSCHQPERDFSDGESKSLTNDGNSRVKRNAPGLINSVYSRGFFYDLRAQLLTHQFEHVILNGEEFNTSLLDILKKLQSNAEYSTDFEHAFPEFQYNQVNPFTFNTALASYVSSLHDLDAVFDRFMRGEVKDIPTDAKRGFNLFMGKAQCATCHYPPLFSGLVPPNFEDSETEVLGVPATKQYQQLDNDLGRFENNVKNEDVYFYRHSFKTQTVRKLTKTAPYMHNGVFDTLDEVMEFYNHGGGLGHGLDVPGQTLSGDSLQLSKRDIKSLISFLKLLD